MYNSITEVAEALAGITSSTITMSGGKISAEKALDLAARSAQQNAMDALTRTGIWTTESTSEQIQETLFFGSVAADALDGEISRPSTGNVRQFILARVVS